MSIAAYNGAKALLERDFADDPEKLATAIARLDALRVNRASRPATCTNCGRPLRPAQVTHCSPQCASEEWNRDAAVQAASNERTKARWAAEDAAKQASKVSAS
jgi:hypothetical protein